MQSTEIQMILAFNMNIIKFAKFFRKKQIISFNKARDVSGYLKKLEGIEGEWFSLREYRKTRKEIKELRLGT